MTRARIIVTAATMMALGACGAPDTPQVTGPLKIDVPELCTRCIEVLKCEGADTPTTVYVLDQKSFWAQIATIWDYLIQMVSPKTEDFRETTVYAYGENGSDVTAVSVGRTRLDVWNRKIELPNAIVDQTTGMWDDGSGNVLGTCMKLEGAEGATLARTLMKLEGPGQ